MANTLAELLQRATTQFHDRIALVGRCGLRDDLWTYGQLERTAEVMGWQLLECHGLKAGDRILIHGPNSPQLVASYLGCFRAGLIVVPIDQHASLEFIERIAASTQASALLANDGSLQVGGGTTIALTALTGKTLDTDERRLGEPPSPDDIAEIVFTSGTTGNPKGVVLTHRNIVSNVLAVEPVYPKQAKTRFLSLLPLSHMFEQTAGLLAPLSLGATVYFSSNFQSTAIMRKLEGRRIDGVIAVPQMLDVILQGLEKQIRSDGGGSNLEKWWQFAERLPFAWRRWCAAGLFPAMAGTPKFFVCGGAPLPASLERRWELLGVRVIQGYGATECSPVIAVNHFDDRIAASVGWPVNGVSVELSEIGEILVQGDNVSQGYWQNQAASRLVFTERRAYRTGDLGEIGSRGELYIKGRSKDMIVLANGLNVFPEDIEQVLAGQAGIGSFVVTDLPDRHGRQSIAAIFSFPENADLSDCEKTAEEAVRNANDLLAPHQRIGAIHIWPGDFPRTALLKVQRWKVRERFLTGKPLPEQMTESQPFQNKSATIEQLLAGVCRVSEDSISDDSDLVLDLGFDSLARVELANLIDEQLGVICDDVDLIAIRRVGELKALIARGEQSVKHSSFAAWPLSVLASSIRQFLLPAWLSPLHGFLSSSFEVKGEGNLDGLPLPALFIANHASHVDTLAILRAMPGPIRRRLCIAAAADYFFQNRLAAAGLALLINAFPFSREGAIRRSLEYCGELIDRGWSLLIYPEGTRSPDGQLLSFKPGIGYLATGLGMPVVPIAVEGGHHILPKGRIWPKRGPVKVHFGKPIEIAADVDKLQATELLHECLARLIEQQKLE